MQISLCASDDDGDHDDEEGAREHACRLSLSLTSLSIRDQVGVSVVGEVIRGFPFQALLPSRDGEKESFLLTGCLFSLSRSSPLTRDPGNEMCVRVSRWLSAAVSSLGLLLRIFSLSLTRVEGEKELKGGGYGESNQEHMWKQISTD